MDKKKKKTAFPKDIRKNSRFFYPYNQRPIDISGNQFLDISPEMLGEDLLFSDTDPNGSYTGVPKDSDDVPGTGRGRPVTGAALYGAASVFFPLMRAARRF